MKSRYFPGNLETVGIGRPDRNVWRLSLPFLLGPMGSSHPLCGLTSHFRLELFPRQCSRFSRCKRDLANRSFSRKMYVLRCHAASVTDGKQMTSFDLGMKVGVEQ